MTSSCGFGDGAGVCARVADHVVRTNSKSSKELRRVNIMVEITGVVGVTWFKYVSGTVLVAMKNHHLLGFAG